MNKSEFKNLALRWDKLNDEYDFYIKNGFKSLESVSSDQVELLKKMQEELYNIETTWFKIVEGEIKIEQ